MVKRVQRYGETSGALAAITGLAREIIVNVTKWTLTVHDGVTPGGHELARADGSNIVAASGSSNGLMSSQDKTKLDNIPADFDYAGTEAAIASGFIPSGLVASYAGATAPSGWLICDGSAISRTTYANLFAAIGTTYGVGDGSTTFNIPDLRGRGVFGLDGGTNRITQAISGIAGNTLGATGGDQRLHGHTHAGTTGNQSANHTHTVTIGQDGSHTHTATVSTGAEGGSGVSGGGTGSSINVSIGAAGNHTHTATVGNQSANHNHSFTTNTSGSGSSENMPPAIMLNYIIKT